jgi:protein-S-isoprenylcysteine O-methyltransferase Ste14
MIIGVLIVLIGESVSILSLNILIWALIFFIINNVYFLVYEEPDLEKRFGNEYREYKKTYPVGYQDLSHLQEMRKYNNLLHCEPGR